jgi:hypothetical protein
MRRGAGGFAHFFFCIIVLSHIYKFIHQVSAAFDLLVTSALDLMESEYGFIGEVRYHSDAGASIW